MKPARIKGRLQQGASLIEVMVAMLLLSFSMLCLGTMLSIAIQVPKLSGYQAIAINLAASHVERIRANPEAFGKGLYNQALGLDGTSGKGCSSDCSEDELAVLQKRCSYPACDPSSLAAMDNATDTHAVRVALPAGDMKVQCDTAPCTAASYGNLWIVWQAPPTHYFVKLSATDNCPAEVTGATSTDPRPRCLYLRFKV